MVSRKKKDSHITFRFCLFGDTIFLLNFKSKTAKIFNTWPRQYGEERRRHSRRREFRNLASLNLIDIFGRWRKNKSGFIQRSINKQCWTKMSIRAEKELNFRLQRNYIFKQSIRNHHRVTIQLDHDYSNNIFSQINTIKLLRCILQYAYVNVLRIKRNETRWESKGNSHDTNLGGKTSYRVHIVARKQNKDEDKKQQNTWKFDMFRDRRDWCIDISIARRHTLSFAVFLKRVFFFPEASWDFSISSSFSNWAARSISISSRKIARSLAARSGRFSSSLSSASVAAWRSDSGTTLLQKSSPGSLHSEGNMLTTKDVPDVHSHQGYIKQEPKQRT